MAGDLIGDMDVDYAKTVAETALRSMLKQSVPATPSNFSVWFNYAMGASPALRKTIDILIGNKRKFVTSSIGPTSGSPTLGRRPESAASIQQRWLVGTLQ